MRTPHVVLIDPQPIFRAGVQSALEATGTYQVVAVTGPEAEAMAICQAHQADVALIGLPAVDRGGLHTAWLLSQQAAGPQVVLLAHESGAAVRRDAARAGAMAVLPRDVSATELISTLDRVVAGENLLGGSPRSSAGTAGLLAEDEADADAPTATSPGSGSSADEVSQPSPIVDPHGRLATLLREYERDEIWLHVKQLYPLSSQHAQVVVEVVDHTGAVLPAGSGRARPHTFRLDPEVPGVVVGQRFHVARDRAGVRVARLPAAG